MRPTSYAPLRVAILLEEDADESCHYCGTSHGAAPPDGCPFATGVYPVGEPVKCECQECENLVGVCCSRCGDDLDVGDSYRLVDVATGMLAVAPADGVAVCLVCADAQGAAVRELLDAASGD